MSRAIVASVRVLSLLASWMLSAAVCRRLLELGVQPAVSVSAGLVIGAVITVANAWLMVRTLEGGAR